MTRMTMISSRRKLARAYAMSVPSYLLCVQYWYIPMERARELSLLNIKNKVKVQYLHHSMTVSCRVSYSYIIKICTHVVSWLSSHFLRLSIVSAEALLPTLLLIGTFFTSLLCTSV